jgi:CRISPR-associated protein Cas6
VADDSLEVVDLHFPLSGRAVPLDYADALWEAIGAALPWLETDPLAGIHPLYGLSPGEGEWYISRRTRLILRLGRESAAAAAAELKGASLQVGSHRIELGAAAVRELVYSTVIYSKFVAVEPASAAGEAISEDAFVAACRAQCDALGMRPRLVCGKARRAQTPAGLLSGFSLMLYDLEREEILRLQSEGLGVERKRGCGIFIPHKSGASVRDIE